MKMVGLFFLFKTNLLFNSTPSFLQNDIPICPTKMKIVSFAFNLTLIDKKAITLWCQSLTFFCNQLISLYTKALISSPLEIAEFSRPRAPEAPLAMILK